MKLPPDCIVLSLLPLLLVAVLTGPAIAQTEPESLCPQGKELYEAGDFDAARTEFRRCLDAGGQSVEILLPLTVMAVRGERPEEAVEYATRAAAIAPDDAEVKYWLGRSLLRAGRVDAARAEWEAGLQLSFEHVGILEGLARLAMTEGRLAQAYNLLTQLQRQGVDDPWLHRLLADIAASKGLWKQTLDHLDQVFAREQPDLETLLMAVEVSLMAGDGAKALELGRRAVSLEPGSASYGGLGEVFFAVEEMDSAIVYLRLAVEQNADDARSRFNLANALEVSGLVDEAEQHFLFFLQALPDDPVGHFNFGVHLQKQGRFEEALQHVTLAINFEPTMLSARVVRTQVLETLGRWDEALAELAALREADAANDAELTAWEARVRSRRDSSAAARGQGQVHLLHMVLADPGLVPVVRDELAKGTDFSSLVVRFSSGPAAAKGGDIGWMNPDDLNEALRTGVAELGENEISPPLEAGGLVHLFKRIP